MKRRVTWIRHGQSAWNAEGRWQGHTDTPLSERGRREAQALGQRLSGISFDAVYSSDLQRALHTARLVLPEADISVDNRLREIHFGVYEGKTWQCLSEGEREAVNRWWVEPYGHKLEGGESMECLNTRVATFLSELPDEINLAVFTHGGVIRNAIWQVVGPPLSGSWSVQIDNTSMTVLEYTERRTLIHCINDRSHLDALESNSMN